MSYQDPTGSSHIPAPFRMRLQATPPIALNNYRQNTLLRSFAMDGRGFTAPSGQDIIPFDRWDVAFDELFSPSQPMLHGTTRKQPLPRASPSIPPSSFESLSDVIRTMENQHRVNFSSYIQEQRYATHIAEHISPLIDHHSVKSTALVFSWILKNWSISNVTLFLSKSIGHWSSFEKGDLLGAMYQLLHGHSLDEREESPRTQVDSTSNTVSQMNHIHFLELPSFSLQPARIPTNVTEQQVQPYAGIGNDGCRIFPWFDVLCNMLTGLKADDAADFLYGFTSVFRDVQFILDLINGVESHCGWTSSFVENLYWRYYLLKTHGTKPDTRQTKKPQTETAGNSEMQEEIYPEDLNVSDNAHIPFPFVDLPTDPMDIDLDDFEKISNEQMLMRMVNNSFMDDMDSVESSQSLLPIGRSSRGSLPFLYSYAHIQTRSQPTLLLLPAADNDESLSLALVKRTGNDGASTSLCRDNVV